MKNSLLLLIFVGFVFGLTTVDSGEAQRVSENFASTLGSEFQVENVQRLDGDGTILAYVCELAPEGFVVVPGIREVAPVLAYSLDGDFSFDTGTDNILLDMVRDDMTLRIEGVFVTEPQVITENARLWNVYLDRDALHRELETLSTYGPLTDTEWSQSSPYYNSCPVDPNTGTHCVTGCVGTALAQMINYWAYPPDIEFRTWDSYTSRNDPDDGHGERIIEIDAPAASMSEINYNGSGVHPTTETMADLLYAAGVSVEMKYSSEGSSAYTANCATALRNKWGYDDADVFSDVNATFYSTLQENIRHGKPALFAIFRAEYSVGHAVICDGWRDTDNMYHVNYGWGGYYCGPSYWYSLPTGLPSEFIILHQAIMNITPPPSECESDAPDNCSEAIELTITATEQIRNDKIDSNDDEDWFQLNLQSGVEYTFYTTGPTDTYAELYSYCGGSSIRSADAGGEGDNFLMVYTPTSTGDYFLRIPGYYYSPADSYALHYTASDFIEPDVTVDYPDGGETLDEGDEVEILWLSEGVPAISEVKIEYSITGSFGSYTTVVERTPNDGSFDWLVPAVDVDETECFVRISDADDPSVTDKSDYEFTIADITLPDPSGSCYSALALPMSETETTREDAINPSGDMDWYRFDLVAGRSYTFCATGSIDTYAVLYETCGGSILVEDDDAGEGYNFSISYSPETSGEFKLKVQGFDESVTGDYLLHWQDNGITDAPDVCSSATPLEISSTLATRPEALSGEYDMDWFRFELDADTDYHFYTTGSTDTYAEIYSSCGGAVLLSDDDGGSGTNCHLVYRPDFTDTYYLMIWGYWEGPSDEEYTLNYYAQVPEVLVVTPEGGEEVFEGSNITIEWITESVPEYTNLRIQYSISGEYGPWITAVSSTENDGAYVWEAADVTGIEDDCYIKIYDPSRPATSDVSDAAFTIKDIPPEEGGDGCATATYLTVTETEQTFDECLAPLADVDYYQIWMVAGNLYSFWTTGGTDTYAELYDDCIMPRIAYNDDGGFEFNCRIDYLPTATGTYYVAIRGYSDQVTGNYTLHYMFNPEGMDVEEAPLPTASTLSAHPNPFNGACSITAPAGESVSIYNVKGEITAQPGLSRIWTPGRDVPTGKYLVRTESGNETTVIYMK